MLTKALTATVPSETGRRGDTGRCAIAGRDQGPDRRLDPGPLGPISGYGRPCARACCCVDEINEQGGIHGRKLKLLVEDSG